MGRHAKATFSWKDKATTYNKIVAELKKTAGGETYAKVGIMGDVKDRHVQAGDPVTSVELGIIHEFGAPAANIPERSWLRSGVDRFQGEWYNLRYRLIRAVYGGEMTIKRALGLLGAKASADIKAHVTQGEEIPPGAMPATFFRKLRKNERGFNRTGEPPRNLVDTGRMIGSVTWQVVMEGKDEGGGGE